MSDTTSKKRLGRNPFLIRRKKLPVTTWKVLWLSAGSLRPGKLGGRYSLDISIGRNMEELTGSGYDGVKFGRMEHHSSLLLPGLKAWRGLSLLSMDIYFAFALVPVFTGVTISKSIRTVFRAQTL
ncbi:hypothetical protein RvY_15759-1 [Ramazzottius varieornatus]|uniref:Uncharacterized protein n=1 Tax=Ramazzottius varieornatus TaxID=947166 RepID=A0A1D1VZ57_RAMVA|nr:hypothetical protein RvY_15759-1 [Ramazzottius varieornatus]